MSKKFIKKPVTNKATPVVAAVTPTAPVVGTVVGSEAEVVSENPPAQNATPPLQVEAEPPVLIPEKPAPVKAEAPVVIESSEEKKIAVIALEDHKCTIIGEEVIIKKDRTYNLSVTAAQVLSTARKVIKK